MDLVLWGPAGGGRGPQDKNLLEEFGMPQISTGDIMRDAVRRGTDLGKKAKPLMEAGKLVPDDMVVGIAMEHLRQVDPARGFILDGFPRTIPQAGAVASAVKRSGGKIEAAVSPRGPAESPVERPSG